MKASGGNTSSNQSVGERQKEKNIDNSFVLIREHENIQMCSSGVTVVPLKLKRVAGRESEAERLSHETD